MKLLHRLSAFFKAVESNVHPGVDEEAWKREDAGHADIADTGDTNGDKDSTHGRLARRRNP